MAMHVYFLLFTLCALFGTSFQQRQSLRTRLEYVKIMLDSVKAKTQMDIYELREAVSLLQNRSEENTPSTIDRSPLDAASIDHIESIMKRQDITIKPISKAMSDEKVYTRDQMNETEQMNHKLAQQVQGLAIDLSQTKQSNEKTREKFYEFKTNLTKTKQTNIKLAEELQEVKRTNTELTEELHGVKLANTKLTDELHEVKSKLNKQIEDNNEEVLGLIAEMHQKMYQFHQTSLASANTVTTTQETTTESGPSTSTVTVPTVLATCPDGWKMFQGMCYLHVPAFADWNRANSWCADHGGILAEPDTREKQRFLIQIKDPRRSTWLGGSDRQTEGSWRWKSSGKPVHSSLWMPGQPDSMGGSEQDCLGMGNEGLRDLTCTSWYSYICEKPANN